MEVRDLWPQTIVDMGELREWNPLTKLLRTLEMFLYRRAERIVVLAPRMGEYISARGISEGKIGWIPNGVDLTRFEDTQLQSPSGDEFRVMYLGAHGQANALDVLLWAAKVLQDWGDDAIRFTLIGDGPEKLRLIKLAKELRLNNVEFRDPVKKANVPKVLHEADAAVFILNDLPLYKYGISLNKLFDYLAAKKPLILAGNPVNNPVEEADCGLTVPPGDPEALAAAVIRMREMEDDERQVMGQRGHEYVRQHHDVTVLAGKLIRCLEEVT